MAQSKLIQKIKRFFKATFSFIPSYYSNYENAYEDGFSDGYEEGQRDGWNEGKSEGKIAWRDLYQFLQERGYIDKGEEITTFDMFERLYEYERDLKSSINLWKNKFEKKKNDDLEI